MYNFSLHLSSSKSQDVLGLISTYLTADKEALVYASLNLNLRADAVNETPGVLSLALGILSGTIWRQSCKQERWSHLLSLLWDKIRVE